MAVATCKSSIAETVLPLTFLTGAVMVFRWMFSAEYPQYKLLARQHDGSNPKVSKIPSNRLRSWQSILALSAIFLCSNILSYYNGRYSRSDLDSGMLSPAGRDERLFEYNRTFSTAPTPETDQAWKALFPENGGFIHHPKLATNFSGVAVFHQLHCLKGLSEAYYASLNSSSKLHVRGENPKHKDHSVHVRHCLDYLRQSLMCAADTNLETYNYELDGVRGWGVKRCRDYEGVVDFVNRWGGSKYLSSHGT